MNDADRYVQIIMHDERENIVSETPTVFEDDYIVRVYEFEDGAVVNYEWRNLPDERISLEDRFNHRFTLEKLPLGNPANLEKGIIEVIYYSS